MPRGVYDVSFTGTHIETLSGGEVPPGQDPMTVPGPEIVLEQFLDEKYSNRKTSGIIYDTKDGPVLNITVEKPKT